MLKNKKFPPTPKLREDLYSLHKHLRAEMKKKWDRVLPFNELVLDRWEKASFLKAKKGASVYDSSYIYGNVAIGKNTWVGPFTILDGSGGKITIGDYCSISSGVQIYTHNAMKWAVSGGKASYEWKNVSIGSCCYIGPYSLITMGNKIGHHSVVGAHSFVNKSIPPYSIAFGIPAKVVGKVKVKGKDVTIEYF